MNIEIIPIFFNNNNNNIYEKAFFFTLNWIKNYRIKFFELSENLKWF